MTKGKITIETCNLQLFDDEKEDEAVNLPQKESGGRKIDRHKILVVHTNTVARHSLDEKSLFTFHFHAS